MVSSRQGRRPSNHEAVLTVVRPRCPAYDFRHMIVWLASYPRSGNTFLRIALNRLHGVQTSTVYDSDGVAERLGPGLIGAEPRPAGYDTLRASPEPRFIKTHRQRDERIRPEDRAICLVRDGRDALVSYARLQSEQDGAFEHHLRTAIETTDPRGTGSWGANVLNWLQPPSANHTVIRYEDLIRQPADAVQAALEQLSLQLPTTGDALPTFADLANAAPNFFRKGSAGAWRTEMPPDLLDLFWSRADNRAAMNRLGYS